MNVAGALAILITAAEMWPLLHC